MTSQPASVQPPPVPDFAGVTSRQQQTWATGDFNVIALSVIGASEQLVEALDPRPGQRVLDVACGSGNASIIAARRYCDVMGVDYVPELLDRARQRATAEGTRLECREGDAQALPLPDASFDVVMSVFGVMFPPDQTRTANELLRVCRPGAKIGLANWTPDGWGGDLFRALSKHLPPVPPGMKPGVRWGTEEGIRELLGDGVSDIQLARRECRQHYRSIDHALDLFFTYYGPTARPYAATNAAGRAALRQDVAAVFQKYNDATDGTCVMRGEYLQVLATCC